MTVKKIEEKVKPDKIKCLKCRLDKSPTPANYYNNTHPLFGTEKLEICKECIFSFLGDKNSKHYLHRVCMVLSILDRPFISSLWESTNGEWSKYVPQLSSLPQNRGLTYMDSDHSSSVSTSVITSNSSSLIGDTNPINDEKYYSSKWMGEYSESELSYLESYYKGLDGDFKIITTNHKDYAKKIAKASLHMDKCFQDMLSGISGADKKYKEARETFDTLSKSAQFSESQRGQNDVSLGCFGRVFDQVETKTYIPEHIVTNPDDIDKMIEDFKHIFKSI